MMKIKCQKCGKVYKFEDKICPVCGYNIEEDPNLPYRSKAAIAKEKSEKMEEEARRKAAGEPEKTEEKFAGGISIKEDAGGMPRVHFSIKIEIAITIVLILIIVFVRMTQ